MVNTNYSNILTEFSEKLTEKFREFIHQPAYKVCGCGWLYPYFVALWRRLVVSSDIGWYHLQIDIYDEGWWHKYLNFIIFISMSEMLKSYKFMWIFTTIHRVMTKITFFRNKFLTLFTLYFLKMLIFWEFFFQFGSCILPSIHF